MIIYFIDVSFINIQAFSTCAFNATIYTHVLLSKLNKWSNSQYLLFRESIRLVHPTLTHLYSSLNIQNNLFNHYNALQHQVA